MPRSGSMMESTDTLAFDAAGLPTSVDFTVELPPASKKAIWRQMRDKTRNVIRFTSTRTRGSMDGATSLLIWAVVQHAALKGLAFDMDGVHVTQRGLPNILLLTGFGGVARPRHLVKRSSVLVHAAQNLRQLLMP